VIEHRPIDEEVKGPNGVNLLRPRHRLALESFMSRPRQRFVWLPLVTALYLSGCASLPRDAVTPELADKVAVLDGTQVRYWRDHGVGRDRRDEAWDVAPVRTIWASAPD
jgi:hypothetical protein